MSALDTPNEPTSTSATERGEPVLAHRWSVAWSDPPPRCGCRVRRPPSTSACPTLRQTLLEHAIPHVRLGTRWKIDVAVLDEHLHRA